MNHEIKSLNITETSIIVLERRCQQLELRDVYRRHTNFSTIPIMNINFGCNEILDFSATTIMDINFNKLIKPKNKYKKIYFLQEKVKLTMNSPIIKYKNIDQRVTYYNQNINFKNEGSMRFDNMIRLDSNTTNIFLGQYNEKLRYKIKLPLKMNEGIYLLRWILYGYYIMFIELHSTENTYRLFINYSS